MQRMRVRAPASHIWMQILFYEIMNRSWCTYWFFWIKNIPQTLLELGKYLHMWCCMWGGKVYLTHWPTHTRTHTLSSVLAVWRGAWQLCCWGSVVWCDPDCDPIDFKVKQFLLFFCVLWDTCSGYEIHELAIIPWDYM